jgi:hypothetical protein
MADQYRLRAVEQNVSLGLEDPRDLAEVQAYGYVTRIRESQTVPLADLLRHMEAHYSEPQLRNDLDAVLSLCESDRDRLEIKRFAKAKLSGKPYELPGFESRQCERCRKPFTAKRKDAKFCSASCRQRQSRKTAMACHR